jgi:iron complex outermembrane receptor protein
MKKLFVLIAGIVWSWCACAQQTDTISGYHQTEDVVIVARATDGWGPFNAVSPLKRKQWMGSDLGSYLDAHGLAHQLTAGAPGAAGSLRFHGLSSDHTLLTWYGMPINSVTLGTCDMSLLPMFFFDSVYLRETPTLGGNMQQGMGTTIGLGNAYVEETSAQVFTTYNSLNNFMLGVDSKVKKSMGGRHFTSQVRAFRQQFNNRYRYTDIYRIDKPVLWQDHQRGAFTGCQVDLSYSYKNQSVTFRSWWQTKSMELPEVMGSHAQGSATQDDATLRSMLEYHWWKPRAQAGMQVAHAYEKLHYVDEPVAINSDIRSQMLWANGWFTWKPFNDFFLKVSASQAAVNVMNSNYADGRINKPWGQYALQIRYMNRKHDWEGGASLEERFGSKGWSSSLSYRYYLLASQSWSLSPIINIARRYRLPDMNELFWTPGGNPNLKPELGYHGRAGLVAFLGKDTRTQWRLEPTVFYSRVNDWIQWVPSEGSVWTPVNFREAQTQGAEMYVLCEKLTRNDRTRYRFETRWTLNDVFWTDSLSMQEQRRMIYSPRFVGYQGASIQRGMHTASIGYRYVSERFTDEANTPHRALNAYGLCNVWYQATVKRNGLSFDISAGVDNVFDVAYETLRAYAMPGRVYRVGLTMTYNQQPKNKSYEIELDSMPAR